MDWCELNFTEICRCCKRTESGMTSIFDGNAHPKYPPVEEMLRIIASLNVQENDELPLLVCTTCLKEIQDSYTFRQKVIQTDSELWQVLARRKQASTLPQEDTNDVYDANQELGNYLKSLLVHNKTSEDKENEFGPAPAAHKSKKARYSCDQCDKSYSILKSLQTHVRDHHCFATIYECKLCNTNISKKHHLRRHLYLHLKEKPFVCNQCKLGFNCMNSMIKHQDVCNGDASLTCEVCNRAFTVKTSLELHKGFHGSEEANRSLTLEDLEEPMQYFYQHGTDDNQESITKIEVVVQPDLVSVPEHEHEEGNELKPQQDQQEAQKRRIYNCIICGLKFKRMYHLKRHLQVHCTNKPFACTICDRSFGRKDKFVKHSKICKGIGKLVCEVCNKTFKSERSLEIHKTAKYCVKSEPSVAGITITPEDIELNLQKYYSESYEDVGESANSLSSNDDNTNDSANLDQDLDAAENVEPEVEIDETPGKSRAKRKKTSSLADAFEEYKCKLCDFTCSRLYHLKRHLQTHLQDKPFACSKCNRTFARRDKMLRHWRNCNGEERFACDICNYGFRTDETLRSHKATHHAGDEGKDSSQVISLTLQELKDPQKMKKYYTCSANEHFSVSDDDALLKVQKAEDFEDFEDTDDLGVDADYQEDADDGNNVDSSDGEYTPHGTRKKARKSSGRGVGRPPKVKNKTKVQKVQKADEDEPTDDDEPTSFTCLVCSKMFERIALLEAHGKECHENEHVLKCAKCSATYSRVQTLNQHMRRHHEMHVQGRMKRPKRFECDHCLKRFTTMQAKRLHAKKHKEGGFVCPKCSKPFLSKSNLTEHMKFHNNTKKFLCSECGQGFVRNDYLIIHMRRHSGEKPFKCNYCGKGFPRVTDLKVHERYHTGEKKHLCVVCGRGFIRAYNLTVHMRTHTGEKPYKCQYCDSAFAQCNDLKSHIRRHTGERFQCDLCPLNFLMGYELIQHKRKIHGMNIVSNIRRLNAADNSKADSDGQEPETVKLPDPVIPCASDLDPDHLDNKFFGP